MEKRMDMKNCIDGNSGMVQNGALCKVKRGTGSGVERVVMELHGGGPNEKDAGVVNMREEKGALVAAGRPKRTVNSMPGVLWGCVKGEYVYINGNKVYSGGKVLGVLPARPRCSVVRDNVMIIMTEKGDWKGVYREKSKEWSVSGGYEELPEVAIEATSRTTVTATSKGFTMKDGKTHWGGPMSEDDRRKLTETVTDAYDEAAASAEALGLHAQPIVAWYELKDRDGRVVTRSTPKVVGAESGLQGTERINMTVGRSGGVYNAVSGGAVKIEAYGVGVKLKGSSSAAERVAVAEIYMSRGIDPINREGSSGVTFGASTTTSGTLHVRLPLKSGATMIASGVAERQKLWSEKPVAVIVNPFGEGDRTVTVGAGEGENVAELLTRKENAGDALKHTLSAPHRFTASCGTVTGDIVAWGGVETIAAIPPGAEWLASKRSSQSWRAVTAVTISHNSGSEEVVVHRSEGKTGCPLTLSPIVAYPHPSAVSMSVEVTAGDGTRRGITVPLKATVTGGMAMYTAPGLAAIELMPRLTAMEVNEVRKALTGSGDIAVCHGESPLTVMATARIAEGRVTALAGATRSSRPLDIGRRHLIAMTDCGIHAVGVNPSNGVAAVSQLDSRGVKSAAQAAWTPEGVLAIAGGCLVAVDGPKVRTMVYGLDATAIGWCGRYGEVWCSMRDGSTGTINSAGRWCRREDVAGVEKWMTVDGRLHGCGNGYTYEPDDEEAGPVAVKWWRRALLAGMQGRRVRHAVVVMKADEWSGRVKLLAGKEPLVELEMTGKVERPIHVTPLGTAWHEVTVEIAGTCEAGGMVERVECEMSSGGAGDTWRQTGWRGERGSC